jgi:hypothetical protein
LLKYPVDLTDAPPASAWVFIQELIMKISKAVSGLVVVTSWVAWSGTTLAEEEKGGSSFSVGASAGADSEGASADAAADGSAAETSEPAPPPEAPKPEPAGGTSYATAPADAAADAPPPGGTDHSKVVGTFGIGYMGFRDLGATIGGNVPLIAPVIGMRYWLDPGLGIDAGLGFSKTTGEVEADNGMGMTDTTEAPGPLVFVLHAGLPLALADSQHFVFQVVPELNIGYASHTFEDGAGEEDKDTVLQFDIGARAGAEIHFGFIDIPQLALQAGVGLRFAMRNASFEDDGGPTTATTDVSSKGITTTVGDNPWNIFAANVAALYYFDD